MCRKVWRFESSPGHHRCTSEQKPRPKVDGQRIRSTAVELQLVGIVAAGVKDSRPPNWRFMYMISFNKTRQGYARKRNLKPAGYFFVRPQ